jgi:glutathione-regulated potassium-efflux system ancillary protein KefG
MNKILINFYHPRFEDSNVHKTLLEGLPKDDSTIMLRDQYELYPDFDIDIKMEQHYLLEADVIIFQHPIFWYNCPPLMKQWLDLVLEYGWAYGRNGDKLKDKKFVQIVSTAGGLDAYQHEGRNRFTLREFLIPFEQTALLCNMDYLPPLHIPNANILSKSEMTHFKNLYDYFIQKFKNDEIDFEEMKKINYLNDLAN